MENEVGFNSNGDNDVLRGNNVVDISGKRQERILARYINDCDYRGFLAALGVGTDNLTDEKFLDLIIWYFIMEE